MSRICNIHHACKKCGAKVKGNVRFCTECAHRRNAERAIWLRAANMGISADKIHVGVVK